VFQSTRENSNISHGDNFLLHRVKLGVQSQKLGMQLHPLLQCRTAILSNYNQCWVMHVTVTSYFFE